MSSMTATISQLYEGWIYPLVDASNARDNAAFERAQERLRRAQADSDLDEDSRRALGYALAYYTLAHWRVLGDREMQVVALEHARDDLARPSCGPISSLLRRRYLLQVRIIGCFMGVMPLPEDEFDEMLSLLPPEDRHTEQWYLISNYCFQHRDRDRIVQAYEQYLELSDNWERDYNWRRLDLMVKLLDGRASKIDVELFFKSIMLPGCIEEIRQDFWPLLEAQNLLDEELLKLFNRRCMVLETEMPIQY
jgi:hypothetical protein